VFYLPSGLLTDRFGTRLPLVIGLGVLGTFTGLFVWVSRFAESFLLRFLGGIGGGLIILSTTRAVILWFPEKERATVMGFKQSGVNLGGIIGGMSLPTLAIMYSWRLGFIVAGGLGIIGAVIAFLSMRDPPHSSYTEQPKASVGRDLRTIVRNRDIMLVALASIPLVWAEMAGMSFMVLFLTEAHYIHVVTAGFLLSLAEGAGAIAKPGWGFISDRVFDGKRKIVFLLCLVLAGILSLTLGNLPVETPFWFLSITVFLWGFVAIGWGGIYLTLLGEFGGAESAGLAAGYGLIFTSFGSIAGPPIFGYVVDVFRSYSLAWGLTGMICLASALIVWSVREEKKL
ncbi:MAG: MFS transporter, partial [Nitrososphaeria archaeon]|nr:MFS transporter [Nitrososphaeria archaeon]NIN53064.1 MFS transporter [Nitrososphaeria archaeon]NIQ34231.1 MFS transporter [Nitrososphaeria archaeon]